MLAIPLSHAGLGSPLWELARSKEHLPQSNTCIIHVHVDKLLHSCKVYSYSVLCMILGKGTAWCTRELISACASVELHLRIKQS